MVVVDERSSRHSVKVKIAGSNPADYPNCAACGSVSEWLKETVSKTVGSNVRVGSNPTWPVLKKLEIFLTL